MAGQDSKSWRFNRQVNLSVLVQIIFLASLIVGSWVNLQRQLDLLQRDVTMLLESQQKYQQRLELVQTTSIGHEFRLRAIEKQLPQADIADGIVLP